jgi:subtilisin family serine protease/subtilisin-like proprotein convertase family protein
MQGCLSRRPSCARVRRARLGLERLEDRSLLSAGPAGPAQLLITTTAGEVQQVAVPSGASVQQTLADYRSRGDVASAEVDQRVHASVVPNDPRLGEQWGLNNTGQSGGTVGADVSAPQAWDVGTGSMKVVVGVLDTGIDYTHPDLYQNVWINQGEIPTDVRSKLKDVDGDGLITFRDLNAAANKGLVKDVNGNGYIDGGDLIAPRSKGGWADGVDQDGNGYVDDIIGWNFVNNTNDPFDDNGHGTHVAGIIGATGNNGVGVVGVNWKVSIAALKFLGADGSGSTGDAVLALNYAASMGFQVANNSWGGGGYSAAMASAITSFRDAGGIFVAAAGNDSSNNDSAPNYPSNYAQDNVLAVAATDRNDRLAAFSDYGASTVDLAAPGASILSTTPNNTYSVFSGTSMATPFVSGAAALVWGANPSLSYAEVIARIRGGVDKLSGLTGKVGSGGRLDLAKAMAHTGDSTGPRLVSSSPLGDPTAVTGVRLTFNEAIDTSTFTTADVTDLVGPLGAFAVKSIVALSATQFDVTFAAAQSAAGAYRLDVGPDVRDLTGNKMNQDGDGVNGEANDYARVTFTVPPAATDTYSNESPVPIRDLVWSSSTITVGQDVTVGDLNVKVNLTHPHDGDLYVMLRGPDGRTVPLSVYHGGWNNNYRYTTFDDEAATPIADGAAPFTGPFRPEKALTFYDGKDVRGTWTLSVWDDGAGDVGSIVSWSLIVHGKARASGTSAAEAVGPPQTLFVMGGAGPDGA